MTRLHRFTAHLLLFSLAADPFALVQIQASASAWKGVALPAAAVPAAAPAAAESAPADPERERAPRKAEASFLSPAIEPTGASEASEETTACAESLTQGRAPLVSLVKTLLWPPSHPLVDVGLDVDVTGPCEGRVTTSVAVFADEPDEDQTGDGNVPGDARIDGTALYLRSERKGDADGRVYLVLTTSTLPDGTSGTACATVTVPRSRSKADLASMGAQASAAQAYCEANAAPPPSFFKLAEGVLSLANLPPVVDAGPDQAVDFPGPAILRGTATDDGRPNGTLSVSWSQVDGPAGGTVTFDSPGTAETTASFSQAGTYTLRLTASDGQLTDSDEAVVVVAVANEAPRVDAGPDQEITLPEDTVTLAGAATDDGRPAGSTLTATWSVLSPAGAAVTFADAHAVQTTATLPGAGEYVLRLTADDGQFAVSDDVRVTVHAQPPPVLSIEDATVPEGHEGTTAATVTLGLSYAWSQPVTVDYITEDGTAAAGCDYRTAFGTVTFAPGQTTAELLVPIAGELAPEADETVRIRAGNVSQATLARTEATLTILNDDAANLPPGALSNRAPADRANGVVLPPTLTWSAVDPDAGTAGDVLTHDVHLGTSFATSGQSWARTCPANQGPGPRTAPVSGYDEANDRLILFGGTGTTDESLWILDNASAIGGPSQWTPIPTTGGPVGLGRAASVYDAATNRLFVVGGCSGDCLAGSDQTWILTNANGLGGTPTWSLLAGAGPGPRMDHTIAIDPAARRLIVFGGASAGSPLGDVWLLSDLDGQPSWQELPASGAGPVRSGMTASFDPERNVLVVFGGRAGTQALSDTWVLSHANGSGGSAVWSRLVPAGTPPPGRWGHVAAYDSVTGRLVVYGGRTASANSFVFRDAWMLTGAAGGEAPEWIRLSPNAGPAGQVQAAGAFSASANRLVVAGGTSSTSTATGEIWVLSDAIGTLPLVTSDPAASFTADGLLPGAVYYWRIVTRDGHGAARGSTAWRFTSNAPPAVEAGPDQSIVLPASVITLNGTGTDDGLPTGVLTFTWTASGPGPVTFADASSAVTTASFTAPGTYVLRLTLDDSQLSASDELTVSVLSQPAAGRTWTTTGDFAEGQLLNANGNGDQVQLDATAGAYPFVWIAVSSKGTIVKIDAKTGTILGEYFSSPAGQPRNPSRTTVDLNGNVWTGNRDGNSIVHIGNEENGQCVDRNGNGVIDTSRGFGDLRPWTNTGSADTDGGTSTAADECILHYTRVSAKGTRHLSVTKDNDVWVSGLSGVSQPFDLVDGRTGFIKRSEPSIGYGGYGGLIDRNGVIWSARPLLRWDPALPLAGPNGGNWRGFGHDSYGLCIDPQGNIWETALSGPSTGNPATSGTLRKWAPDGTLLGTFGHGFARAQGCAVDARGDVWVAHVVDGSNTVGHVKNNGAFVGNVVVPSGPTGVAVDLFGKIWSSNHNSRNVSRIDPNAGPIGADGVTRIGAVDFTTPDLGGVPYNYSDMTGSTLVGAPREGRWSVVFDSGLAGAKWGLIRWNESRCGDGSLAVRVASSPDGLTFTADQPAESGQGIPVPDGRYLRITVTFTRATTGESPVLYDLSVGTEAYSVPGDDADQPPQVDAGPDQSVETPNEAILNGSACDDGRPAGALDVSWSKVSGPGDVRFSDPAQPKTRARFQTAGSFNAVEDFSSTTNPSGAWTYGWKPTRTGTFTRGVLSLQSGLPGWLRTTAPDLSSLPVISKGLSGQTYVSGAVLLPAELLHLHPGMAGENAVLRWSAPAAGSYRIEGRFQGISTNNPTVDVAILHNATTVFTGNITSFGQATPFALVRHVEAGDVLDFSVGYGNGNFSNDSTGLTVRVVPVDAAGVGGTYVLRLSASDAAGSAQDDVAVTVTTPECVAPPAGIVGWWPADGLATDLLGGPSGTLAGGVSFGAGMAGQAFFFDGVDDTVTIPASPALNVQAFTLEGWVFPADPRVERPIFEYGTGSPGFGVHLWQNLNTAIQRTAGALYANVMDAGGNNHILATGAGVLVPSTWNHVALTYDPASGKARLYANGRLEVELGAGTFVPKTNPPFNIGHRPSSGNRFAGGIDEATVFSRALTPEEIREIYLAGALGKCKDSINLPPQVNAGPDHAATLRCDGKAVVALQGSVTDDGRPAGGTLTTAWSSLSGPGTVTFANPNAATTGATFPATGDYTLRLTGSDSLLATQDVAVVHVSAFLPPSGSYVDSGIIPSHNGQNNTAPVTVSGLTVGRTYSLYLWGSWAYGNGAIGSGTVASTLVSGFGNPTILLNASVSPFTPTAPLVVWRFEATATSVTMSVQDQAGFFFDNVGQLFFQIYEGVPGEPLVVNAGADQTLTQPVSSVTLAASATEAGLPPVALPAFLWTQVSGPSAAIAAPASATTSVTLSQTGTYVFRVRATGCVSSVQDEVTLVIVERPDLAAVSVDVSGLTVNGQTLAAGGTVSAQVANNGGAAGAFDVTFFEDRNGDGVLDPAADGLLGTASVTSLGAGQTTTASAAVSGSVQFAGSPVHVLVDSGAAVAETNENNNYARSGPPCENAPAPQAFSAQLEWTWSSSSVLPAATNVMSTPMVADLDGDSRPELIFGSYSQDGGILSLDGYLRVLDGATGAERFTVTNSAHQVAAYSTMAVGDIDGDGRPEILAVALSRDKLLAFEHDGSFKWQSPVVESPGWGGAALADLDGDGQPEILLGRTVLNSNGTIRWKGTGGKGEALTSGFLIGSLSLAADLDGNGFPEVVAGNTAYRNDGSILWQVPVPDGLTAVGNFDADPSPEIVLVGSGQVRLIEHDGAVKWGPVTLPFGGAGGAPVVADVDGDGVPEIGVAGVSRYTTFRADGTVKWTVPIQDLGSNVTGASVFDFEGDGAAEVVYSDEIALRVFRGTDGAVLFERPMGGCTAFENPVIADVDADGRAEIVAVANRCGTRQNTGIFVFGNSNWVPTRRIWNQHTYHITNVNDDGTIPARETNSWTRYNSYRQNRLTSGCEFARPDLTASYVRSEESAGSLILTARVGNGGGSTVAAGVPVSFYDRDPATVGTRIATVPTPSALAPGRFVDVSVTVPATTVARPLWVVADDQGGLVGTITEFDETNNAYNSRLFLSTAGNTAPAVDAGPDQRLVHPQRTAVLDGTATDDGQPLGELTTQWTVLQRPVGAAVTFTDLAAVDTTATFSAAGTYVLRLTANDGQATGSDDLTIVVEPPNQAPVVDAGPNQSITTQATALDGTVTDDGLPAGSTVAVQWSKLQGPGTAVFGNASAADTTVTFDQEGQYVLQLSASDSAASGSDTVQIEVAFANAAPVVNAGPDHTLTLPANSLTLTGTATDDGLPLGSTLSIKWSVVVSPGVVTFSAPTAPETTATFSDPGLYVLKLTASDGTARGSDQVQVSVGSAAPVGNAPTVAITSPPEGATVVERVDIVGSAESATLASWRLEYRLTSESTWTRFAGSTEPLAGGVLAVFDPTLLLNGIYEVRLVATDISGRSTSTSFTAVVKGEQKVGLFMLSFVDLEVPVSGLPIRVVRSYDSRDKRNGDFGVGWRMDVTSVTLQESGVAGLHWDGTRSGGFFPNYCLEPARPHSVTFTLPDGRVQEFEMALEPSCQGFVPPEMVRVTFRAVEGTVGSLSPVGGDQVWAIGSWPGSMELYDEETFELYDPELYRYTSPEGDVFIVHQSGGLQSVTDANGNRLIITPGGIQHSSGKGISFVRDALGRVTSITDPVGNAMTYQYDGRGDLIAFTDRESQTTRFTYDDSHGLVDIEDPRGVRVARNEYDAQGRLVRHIDSFGKVIEFSHDIGARRQVITDRLGNTRILEYDPRGNVVREVDAQGGVTLRTYDSRDNKLSETDPNGNTTTFTYDAQDNLLTERDPLGNTTARTYNARRQVLTFTDARGKVSTNTYDANNNLLKTRDALGQETLYTYDGAGNMLTRTDPLGCITRFEYDLSGNLTKETNALGHATTYTYDTNGNRLSETKTRTVAGTPETIRTTFDYDKLGRLVQTTYPDGSTVRPTYDAMGRRIATIDRLGRETRSEFDDMGRLIRLHFPDGLTGELSHDDEGRVVSTSDRAGRLTSYTYDGLGRLLTTTNADSTSETDAYDAGGRLTATTDATGATTRYEYDAAGRQTKVINPLGHVTETRYDANGNVTVIKDPNGQTTAYEYDDLNRKVRIVFPDGTEERIGYDAMGRIASRTDQAGRTTGFTYDCLGQLLKVTDALGQVTSYTYDEIGSRVSQTDASGRTTAFEYDRMRYPRRRTLPDGASEATTFDSEGNLLAQTDFMGRSTSYTYDAYDRLTERRYHDGTKVTFTYTPTGQRASATDARGTTVYGYDVRDRMISAIQPDGRKLEYSYDGEGRRTRLTATVGTGVLVTDYHYDAAGRLITVTDPLGRAYTHGYDANGNRVSLAQPNGTATTYSYNALNRLGSLTTTHPASGRMIQSYVLTLGPAGNRERITEHDGTVREYAYDELYRLTRETIRTSLGVLSDDSFRYDAVGNRLERTRTDASGTVTIPSSYDNRDRLLSSGARTFGWDDNGNLVSRSGGTTYVWDFDQRLREVRSTNGTVVEEAYDADGNRVEVKVTPPTGPPTLTRYLVDATCALCQIVAESDTAGQLTTYYVRGNDLLSVMRPDGAGGFTTRFYHADGLGSVRRLTDEAGNLTDGYTYTAFGELTAHTGSDPQPFTFAGEPYDPNVGFYQNRERWLDPEAGRFVSPDPFLGRTIDPQSLHQYTYAHLDPVNRTDPSGLVTLSEQNVAISIQGNLNAISRPAFLKLQRQILKSLVCTAGKATLEKTLKANDGHHPIPKFTGAKPQQYLIKLDTDTHRLFHSVLHQLTKALGLPGGLGGAGGSAAKWADFFSDHPGQKVVTLAAVLAAAEIIDKACKFKGRDTLRNAVLENLKAGNFPF